MKRIFTLCMAVCTTLVSFAQTDTTGRPEGDTIHIGGMVIIRKAGGKQTDAKLPRHQTSVPIGGYWTLVSQTTLIILFMVLVQQQINMPLAATVRGLI